MWSAGSKIRMIGAIKKYNERADAVNSLVCVNLDPEFTLLPERFRAEKFPQFSFNKAIIEATHEFVSAYKLNLAFYEARGSSGIAELKMTMDYLQEQHSAILTIADAKRGDIANTSVQYAIAIFKEFGFDAVTLNPYLGKDALQPFLDYKDKGCIIVARTSNPGAREFQDLIVLSVPLWQVVAEKVAKEWNENGNCMLVAGATYPEELGKIRAIVGDMPLLIPGIGAQGGNVQAAVQAGFNSQKKGLIIAVGRSILFAANPAEAARALRDEINAYRR